MRYKMSHCYQCVNAMWQHHIRGNIAKELYWEIFQIKFTGKWTGIWLHISSRHTCCLIHISFFDKFPIIYLHIFHRGLPAHIQGMHTASIMLFTTIYSDWHLENSIWLMFILSPRHISVVPSKINQRNKQTLHLLRTCGYSQLLWISTCNWQ